MNQYLRKIIGDSLEQFELSDEQIPEIELEKPNDPSHGDAAANIAMKLASRVGDNPRNIAQNIVDKIDVDAQKISEITVAGPGFINFRYAKDYLYHQLQTILEKGNSFGESNANAGQKVLIEFVSANPTGPLTVGHGRNAVLGDTIANLLEKTGAEVDREYYFNDAGRQMRVLGQSVQTRYLQTLGHDVKLADGSYEGEYIKDIAQSLIDEKGDKLANADDIAPFKKKAESVIFDDIKATLARMDIQMDSFFNERDLYENNSIDETVQKLRDEGLIYEKEGATWFQTTEFDKDKDTVLIKSSGEPTYRLPDMAYHANKLLRGYDACIDIFGADHIATYPDVVNAVKSMGYDTSKIEVVVYQFVTLVNEGEPFKMSTRKANFVTLDDLMDEVGADVTRFFFLMRSPNTHLEFDVATAKEAGEKNPVFYLQYAHARIHSILEKVEEQYDFDGKPDFSLLEHPSEINLIKTLIRFPKMIQSAADSRKPHRLVNFLNDLATSFTSFYHDCRILGEDQNLVQARVALAQATAQVLSNGLNLLGIQAPEKM